MHFRPSEASIWYAGRCSAYPKVSDSKPHTPRSESATKGVKIHDLARQELAHSILGKGVTPVYGDEEEQLMVTSYVKTVKDSLTPDAKFFIEARIQNDARDCRGVIDFISFQDNECHIWDLKTGLGVVEAEKNPQLLVYAYLIFKMWKGQDYKKFVFHIFQPTPNNPIPHKTWELTKTEAMSLQFTHISGAMFHAKNNPIRRSGLHCRYCHELHSCPAVTKAVMASAEYAGLETPDVPVGNLKKQIEIYQEAEKLLKYRKESLISSVEAKLKKGLKVPGYQLKETKSAPKWTNQDEAADVLKLIESIDIRKSATITPLQAIRKHPEQEQTIRALCTSKTNITLTEEESLEKLQELFSCPK